MKKNSDSQHEISFLLTLIIFRGVKDKHGAYFLSLPAHGILLCAIPKDGHGSPYHLYEFAAKTPISVSRAKQLGDPAL